MARLKKEVQLHIIRALAVFNTPTEVAKDVKDIYGIDLKPQNIETYDPTKRAGKDLRAEFKNEFEETRKDFLEKPLNIPSANKSVQLQILDKLITKNKANPIMAIKLIEQINRITKEFGGNGEIKTTDKASVDLEIRKLELEKLKREVNPPEVRPPDEDYKVVLRPDEEIPDEPIL